MLLKLMTSDLSRLSSYQKLRTYLLICAYDSGAGSVSRAFIRKTRLREVFLNNNSSSPNEGFKHLVRNLLYEATQHHLVQVNKRMPLYR